MHLKNKILGLTQSLILLYEWGVTRLAELCCITSLEHEILYSQYVYYLQRLMQI